MDEEEIEKDARGWEKGKRRKYRDIERKQVIDIRNELEEAEERSIGSRVLKREYQQRFGSEISEWFIQETLKEFNEMLGVQKKEISYDQFVKHVEKKLGKFGKVIMEINCWASKYGKGKKRGINFISCRYVYPFQFGIISQISELAYHEVKEKLKSIMTRYVRPDILRMSYHPVFGVNLSQSNCFGNLTFFLLNLGINPLYSVPKSIRCHREVDWFKRVFSDTFFTQLHFGHRQIKEIEVQNLYLEFRRKSDKPQDIRTKNPYFINAFTEEDLLNRHIDHFLTHHVFFLRIVEPKRDGARITGRINLLGVEIILERGIIHLPVLCKLELRAQSLLIFSIHRDGTFKRQKRMDFVVHNIEYS